MLIHSGDSAERLILTIKVESCVRLWWSSRSEWNKAVAAENLH